MFGFKFTLDVLYIAVIMRKRYLWNYFGHHRPIEQTISDSYKLTIILQERGLMVELLPNAYNG